MVAFRFKNVCLESYGLSLPTEELTSSAIEDSIAPVMQKLGIPFGTLERLTGVERRLMWPREKRPSEAATEAARVALEGVNIPLSEIKALFSCSVTRDYFEPATGTLVHRNLGLSEDGIALDVSNACLGFSNGIFFLANLIETGVVKAGLVVSGETTGWVINTTRDAILKRDDLTREQLIRILPTFTLGCGAVAYLLCHESISTTKHKILGGVTRSATQFNDLCNGNGDYSMCSEGVTSGPGIVGDTGPVMETESGKLLASAAELGGRTWADVSQLLGWSKEDVDHNFCHQVGRQVNEGFYRTMGLDMSKEFTIYRQYGNLVSAALPTCLLMGVKERKIKKGDKIVLTGFGSGLNSLFMGIEW